MRYEQWVQKYNLQVSQRGKNVVIRPGYFSMDGFKVEAKLQDIAGVITALANSVEGRSQVWPELAYFCGVECANDFKTLHY